MCGGDSVLQLFDVNWGTTLVTLDDIVHVAHVRMDGGWTVHSSIGGYHEQLQFSDRKNLEEGFFGLFVGRSGAGAEACFSRGHGPH